RVVGGVVGGASLHGHGAESEVVRARAFARVGQLAREAVAGGERAAHEGRRQVGVGFAVHLAGAGGRDGDRAGGDRHEHVVLTDVAVVGGGDGDAVEAGLLHRSDALVDLLAAGRGHAAVVDLVGHRLVGRHGGDVGDDD